MLNFMLDPTGDAPWEEDPAAKKCCSNQHRKGIVFEVFSVISG